MSDHDTTPAARGDARRRHGLFLALCGLWTAAGVSLPLFAFTRGVHGPSVDNALLVFGSIALTAAFSNVRFAFTHRGARLEVSPDTAFIVLAAVLLPPAQAALVAIAGSYWITRRYDLWRFAYYTANMGLAAGVASGVVHNIVGAHPLGGMVLPAAILAAVAKDVVALTGYVIFDEAQVPRSGIDLVRNTPFRAIVMIDVGLPVAAIAMAGPYLAHPSVAFAVIIAAEAFIWLVMRLLHTEHVQRLQNTYLRDTLSRYMPTPVVDRLLASGTHAAPGGEIRTITVLFCDVRGFTARAEHEEPQLLLAQLNGLLTDLSESIFDTSGTLDKFTGDGLMAFWGAPEPLPDQTERAFVTVERMLAALDAHNEQVQRAGGSPFRIGIGLHTGPAMVGNVGHERRLNYTAIGDTVNLASRLEESTKDLHCPFLMSEEIFLSLPPDMQRRCARMESISIRGRQERVQLYTLVTCVPERVARAS